MSSDSQQDNGPVQYSDDDDYGSDANPDRSSVVSTGVRASRQYRESRNIHSKQARQSLGNLIANKLQQEPTQELFGKVPDDITQIIQKEAQQIQQNLPTEVSNNQTVSNTEEISNKLGNENNGQVIEKTENQVHKESEILASQLKEEGVEAKNQSQSQNLHKQNVLSNQIQSQQINRNETQNQQGTQKHQEQQVGNVDKNESEQNKQEEHKQHQKTGEVEVELKNQQQVKQGNQDENQGEQEPKQDQKIENQNIEQQTQKQQENTQIISEENKPLIEKVEEPDKEEQNKLPGQTDIGVDHEPREERQDQQYFGEAKESRHSLTDEFTKLQELKQIQVQQQEQDKRERIQEVIKHQLEDDREQLIGTEIEQVGQFDDQVQLEVVGTRAPLHEAQLQTHQLEQNHDNHEQIIEQSGNYQNKEHEVKEQSHEVQLTPNYNIPEQNVQKVEQANEHEPVPIVLEEKPNNQQVKIGQQIKTQDVVVDEGVSAQVQPDPLPEPQPDPQIQAQQPIQNNKKQIQVNNTNGVQQIKESEETQIKNQGQALRTGLQQLSEQQNKPKQQNRQEVQELVLNADADRIQKDTAQIHEQTHQQQNQQKHEQKKENEHEQQEHKHDQNEKQEKMEQKDQSHQNRQQQVENHHQNQNTSAQQQIQGDQGLTNASENIVEAHQQHENQVEGPQSHAQNSKPQQYIQNQQPTQEQNQQNSQQKQQQMNVQNQQKEQNGEHEQQAVEVSSPLPVNKWTKAQSQHIIQPTQSDLIVPKPTTTYEHEHRSPQQSRVQDQHFTTEQLKQNPQIYELEQRNIHNTEHEVQHAAIDSKQFIPDAESKVNNFTLGEVNSINVAQSQELSKEEGEIIENVQKVQDNQPHHESDSKHVQSSSPLKQQSMINVSSLSNIAIERRHHEENIKKFIDSDPIRESDLLRDSGANKNNTGTTASNLSEADSMRVQASQKINLIPTVEEVSKKQEDEEQVEQDKPVSKPTMAQGNSKKPKKGSELNEPPKLVLKQSDLGVEGKQQQIMDSEYEVNRKVLATSSVKPKPKTEQKADKSKVCECQIM